MLFWHPQGGSNNTQGSSRNDQNSQNASSNNSSATGQPQGGTTRVANQVNRNEEIGTKASIAVAENKVENVEESTLQNTSGQAELAELEEEAVPLAGVELQKESSFPILMLLVDAGLGLVVVYLIYRRISVRE